MNEETFRKLGYKVLPNIIKYNDKFYKLSLGKLMGGGYRMSYGNWDGDFFNWEDTLIDKIYDEDEENIFGNFLLKLNNIRYEDSSQDMMNIEMSITKSLKEEKKEKLNEMNKKYEYKTLALRTQEDRDELNLLYSEGWEFVNSVASSITGNAYNDTKCGHVYFTIRKSINND